MSKHGNDVNPVLNKDFGARPSTGISWMVLVFIGISLVIIFWQGSNVVGSSAAGHVWPAGDSTKVQLPAAHT